MFERLSPRTRTVLRVSAGIAIGIAAGIATLALLFVGAVESTGCFIACDEPNPIGGGLLLAGSVACAALTVSSVAWGVIGWNRRVLVRIATIVAGLATVIVVIVVASF